MNESFINDIIFATAFGEKSDAKITHFTFKYKYACNKDKHNKYMYEIANYSLQRELEIK